MASPALMPPSRLKNSTNGSITAARKLCGASASSLTSFMVKVVTMPTSMKAPVTQNTTVQGWKSARINARDPGTRPERR